MPTIQVQFKTAYV